MIATLLVLLTVASSAPPPAGAVPVAPDDMTIEQLEATFGPNLLVPDPDGLGPPAGVPDDGVVERWFGAEPNGLNTVLVNDGNVGDSIVVSVAMSPGIQHRLDPDKFAPGIADFATISADRRVVTVRLKKGITWQFPWLDEKERNDPNLDWLRGLFAHGAPEVISEDFRFTLETMLNPQVESYVQVYVEGSSIHVLDRYTFQMRWDRFYNYAFALGVAWTQVLPKFLYERDESGRLLTREEFGSAFKKHWYADRICGYGPYQLAGLERGVEIVLDRKDDFPVVRPALQRIHWQISADGEQVVRRLLDGELDFTVLMPAQLRKYVLKGGPDSPFRNGTFETQRYEKMEYSYHLWNCARVPFDDRRVRRAMGLAFNRRAIFANVFEGFGALVTTSVFDKHPHFNPNVAETPFNLESASELLDDAGWGDEDNDGIRDKQIDGKKVDFRFSMLSHAGSTEYDAMMAIYRDDLKKIGVDMKVEPVAWRQWSQRVMADRDFDAVTGLTAAGWRLDFYYKFHSHEIEEGSNWGGYRNAEVDKLSELYRTATDEDELKRIAFRIQEVVAEDEPLTFFMRRDRLSAYVPRLKNVKFAIARPQLLSFRWYLEHPEKD